MESYKKIIESGSETKIFDVKVKFVNNKSSWLNLTKDIVAFANRVGGYLIFGVKDRTFEVMGVDEETIKVLSDCSEIKKKIGTYVKSDIGLEVALQQDEEIKVLIIKILSDSSDIHVFEQDGFYENEKGEQNYLFRKGQIVIRGDGRNEFLNSANQGRLKEKLLLKERARIFDGITKIVHEPNHYKITSVDDPDAKAIKLVGDNPDAQLVTFSLSSVGGLFSEHSHVMEMIRVATKLSVDIDIADYAKFVCDSKRGRVIEVSRELVFCIASSYESFPKYYTIDYDNKFKPSEISTAYFNARMRVDEKIRLIAAYAVIEKNYARSLYKQLKPAEIRRGLKIKDLSDRQIEEFNSHHYFPHSVSKTDVLISDIADCINAMSKSEVIKYEDQRQFVAKDYAIMKHLMSFV